MAALAPQLRGKQRTQTLQQALGKVSSISDEHQRAWALIALAHHLSGPLLESALKEMLSISREWERANLLVALAPQLSGSLLGSALDAARAISYDNDRAKVLTALVPRLQGVQRTQTLQQALKATHMISDQKRRLEALAALAPQLSTAELQYALLSELLKHKNRKRDEVLELCTNKNSFPPRILSTETIGAIVGHIIEICTKWRWI